MSDLKSIICSEGDLEFYVSRDGRQTAMSQVGLTRCIVDDPESVSAVRRLLNTLDDINQGGIRRKQVPSQLKHLYGKAFADDPDFELPKTQRLIKAEACADIIQYFADLQNRDRLGMYMYSYPKARESLKKFAKHGIDNFIKQLAGYSESINTTDQTTQLLKQLLVLVENQGKKIADMEAKMNCIVKTERQFPGIEVVVNYTNNIVFLPPDLPEPFTIRQWVFKTKGVKLSQSQCMSLGRHASNTLTTLKLESPDRYATGTVYKYQDIPGLESVWESWKKTH